VLLSKSTLWTCHGLSDSTVPFVTVYGLHFLLIFETSTYVEQWRIQRIRKIFPLYRSLSGLIRDDKKIKLFVLFCLRTIWNPSDAIKLVWNFNAFVSYYSGRTAPLTSKRCILYSYSTNTGTEYFKHGIYSPFFPLQNAVCFINLTYLVPLLFTFYIQSVLKLKK